MTKRRLQALFLVAAFVLLSVALAITGLVPKGYTLGQSISCGSSCSGYTGYSTGTTDNPGQAVNADREWVGRPRGRSVNVDLDFGKPVAPHAAWIDSTQDSLNDVVLPFIDNYAMKGGHWSVVTSFHVPLSALNDVLSQAPLPDSSPPLRAIGMTGQSNDLSVSIHKVQVQSPLPGPRSSAMMLLGLCLLRFVVRHWKTRAPEPLA